MTKGQRRRMIFWAAFGFLGVIRTTYGVLHGDVVGIVLGLLWVALGAWKAWSEATRIDEASAQEGPRLRQPDRPAKANRK
jgi:hypothetical protein